MWIDCCSMLLKLFDVGLKINSGGCPTTTCKVCRHKLVNWSRWSICKCNFLLRKIDTNQFQFNSNTITIDCVMICFNLTFWFSIVMIWRKLMWIDCCSILLFEIAWNWFGNQFRGLSANNLQSLPSQIGQLSLCKCNLLREAILTFEFLLNLFCRYFYDHVYPYYEWPPQTKTHQILLQSSQFFADSIYERWRFGYLGNNFGKIIF